VKQAVAIMQDLLHNFGSQILENEDKFGDWKKVAQKMMYTGAGETGTTHNADGKWGGNTAGALSAYNQLASNMKLDTLDVGPYFGKPTEDPKQVVSAAENNTSKIISAMKSLSLNVPKDVADKAKAKELGDVLDMLPNSVGADIVSNVDEGMGSIQLYSKYLGS